MITRRRLIQGLAASLTLLTVQLGQPRTVTVWKGQQPGPTEGLKMRVNGGEWVQCPTRDFETISLEGSIRPTPDGYITLISDGETLERPS